MKLIFEDPLNRRDFLRSTLAATGASAAPLLQTAASDRPNILLLFTDQQRFDALGCAGNRLIRTPNLDAFASSGVRFTNAFTPTPVCIAARMSLITGQRGSYTHWPSNKRLPGPPAAFPTLMSMLADAGYRTHAVGKMHFYGLHYGLHQHERMEEAVNRRIDDDYLMYLKTHGIRTRQPQGLRDLLFVQPQTTAIPVEHAQSTWVADRSIHFLREHLRYRGRQPFFLWTSWIAPHPPFAPCEPYASMYDASEMPLPVYADRPIATLPAPTWTERARLDGAHLDPARMRRLRALYYAQITHIDQGVGRILAELDRLGLASKTVIVFASDHGEMMGNHGLSQKSVPYEPSMHIPMLLRWPGRTEAGRVSNDLVGLTDLLPTFLEAAGARYPAKEPALEGQSLVSAAGGGLARSREVYMVDFGFNETRWVSIRTRNQKYVLWASGGREELYDLDNDPAETRNLIRSQPRRATDFRERVLAWEREHGLPASFESGKWRVFSEPKLPADPPREVVINDGRWPESLPPDEAAGVETYAEAFTCRRARRERSRDRRRAGSRAGRRRISNPG
jgi:arylsulfatase A-like enzyme